MYFKSSPEMIRVMVNIAVRFTANLRNVEDRHFERETDIRRERAVSLIATCLRSTQLSRSRVEIRL